jgi:hypothetical protein
VERLRKLTNSILAALWVYCYAAIVYIYISLRRIESGAMLRRIFGRDSPSGSSK